MHLDRIDILRALAIILVFLHHAQICLFPGYEVSTFTLDGTRAVLDARSALLNFSPAAFGYTGVQLFLLISGFLIHLGTLNGLKNGKAFAIGTFMSKRFWRIYPPYLLVLLFLCFAVQGSRYLIRPDKIHELLSHALMAHNLNDATFGAINPSFWSIALEVQLYLVYPVLLFARKRWGINATFLGTVIMAVVTILLGRFAFTGMGLSYWTSVPAYWYIWCAGALLAERYHAKARLFPTRPGTIAAILFAGMWVSKYFVWSVVLTVPFAVFAWLAFFEWALYVPLSAKAQHSMVFKALSTVGLCSYSIYLIHQPYLRELLRYFGTYGPMPLALLVKVTVVFAILFFLSYALYLLVELPSIAYGARLRNKGAVKAHP